MVYCPECGSEVAQTDTFCAYCGISLQPVAVADTSAIPSEAEENNSAEDKKLSGTFPPGTIEDVKITPLVEEKDELVANRNNSDSENLLDLPSSENISNLAIPKPDFSSSSELVLDNVNFSNESQDDSPLSGTFPREDFVAKNSPVQFSESEKSFDANLKDELKISEENISQDESSSNPEEIKFENLSFAEPKEKIIEQEITTLSQSKDTSNKMQISETREYETEKPSDKPINVKLSSADQSGTEKSFDSFSATIPYIPGDYPLGELPEKSVNESKGNFDENKAQNAEIIKPVISDKSDQGKSALQVENKIAVNDSVLPSDPVSVDISITGDEHEEKQLIENPLFETREDSDEPETIISKPLDNFANISETNADKSSELKEGRPYTVPNLTGTNTDGKKSAKLKPLEEGAILNGRYEIIRKIGGGGMGAVYLASDRNLDGTLRAVKEMIQSYMEESQQEKSVSDFKRESVILSTLDHPAVPTIYDYFFDEKESRFYLVMKYINGGDLAARLRSSQEGKIEEEAVTEWAIQIADVLDYLHNRPTPIIYRDLKPSNIMIDGNSGRVMLIDFGIARSVKSEEKGVTAVGTMGYAPPELFSGNVEPRSDIYSLGSTMFHLLTGADPQSNPLLIFDFNKNPRPRQINSRLSDQIEQILMRAVQYNSSQRFNSASEMRDILKTHLENLKKGMVTYGVAVNQASPSREFNIPVYCGFCGQRILATDVFCPFCGAKQPILNQPASSKLISQVRKTARLMIIGTNELVEPEYVLEKDVNLVGRRDPMSNIFPEVDLSKFDPQTKISRRHAQIRLENNQYLIEDLGSSNGTILMSPVKDAVRLQPRQPRVLAGGDKIKVGDTVLQFVVG